MPTFIIDLATPKPEYRGCANCKHYNLGKCPAFPSGIPIPILSGDIEHKIVLEGQKGETVWEPIAAKKKSN